MSDINAQQPNPTPAVEVVATFGDTVVGVKHVTDPRAGRINNTTRALLVGGALALGGALGGFLYQTKVAADDAAAREKTIQQGRPEWWYQAHHSSRATDVLFGLAGTLGLGALAWGLSRRKDERSDPRVRIGTAAGVDFAAPASPATAFELIAPNAARDGFVLNVAGGMTGEGITGPEQPIALGTRARVRCGALTFHVAGVPAPARQTTPLLATIDRRVASYFAGSLAAHAALLLLLRGIPADPSNTSGDISGDEDVATKYTMVANETEPQTPVNADSGDSGTSDPNGQGIAMSLPGTKGTPDGHSVNPARLKSTGEVSRDEAIAEARQAGILGPDGRLADLNLVPGDADVDRGLDETMVNGLPDGSDGGDGSPNGTFGHGTRGVHDGGDTTVAGDYNTIHDGRPAGRDFTIGPNGGHCATGEVCKGHDPVPPPVHIGRPQGDPDVGAVVQRYIKQYKDQIGYCYEKALLGNPDLEGTVNVSFLLASSGAVLGVDAQGVDGEVDSCIKGVVEGIKFPRLADQGSFQIKYPFVLHKPAR
jgi:hypothetical protein